MLEGRGCKGACGVFYPQSRRTTVRRLLIYSFGCMDKRRRSVENDAIPAFSMPSLARAITIHCPRVSGHSSISYLLLKQPTHLPLNRATPSSPFVVSSLCRATIQFGNGVERRMTLWASLDRMSYYDESWVENALPLNQNV